MKLYFSRGACSLAARIILNETGKTANFESVDIKTKKTEKGEDFFKINHKGAVPVLITDDNQVLTENSVILQFLAESSGNDQLLPAAGDFARYRVLEYLNFISSDVHKGFGPLFNSDISDELKNTIFIPLLKKRLNFLNEQIQQKKYLMGDTFTLPDAYLFVMLLWLRAVNIDIHEWSNLKRYYDALKNRPSIQKSLAEEGIGQKIPS